MSALTPAPATNVTDDEQVEELRKYLTAAIWLPQELDVTLMKEDKIARPGSIGGGALAKNETNPVAFHAVTAKHRLRYELSLRAHDIRLYSRHSNPANDVGEPMNDSTAALALYVHRHLPVLRDLPFWHEVYSGLVRAVTLAMTVVDLPDSVECAVYLEDDTESMEPAKPMTHWSSIPEDVLDTWAEPRAIVEGLRDYKVDRLTAKRISQWGSVNMLPHRTERVMAECNGEMELVDIRTYLVRDVMDTWLRTKEKAAAKAERERTPREIARAARMREYRAAKKAAAMESVQVSA